MARARSALLGDLAVVVGVMGLCGLGAWQLRRDQERNADRAAAMAVAHLPPLDHADPAQVWRLVRLAGRFEGAPLLGSGEVEANLSGYEVYGLFVTDDGDRVLVDRGWLPLKKIDELIGSLPSPTTVDGQLRALGGPPDATALDARADSSLWPGGATAAMARHVGARSLVVAPEAAIAALFERPFLPIDPVPKRDNLSRNYAIQWFLFAGMLAAARIAWRRGRRAKAAQAA